MTWKTWLLGLLICCALLIGLMMAIYRSGAAAGRDEVKAKWSRQREGDARTAARLADQARENERSLQAAADRIRREKDDEIGRLVARHDAAVERLRRRPERPADYVPTAAPAAQLEPASACSADRLFRNDGEFLARLARSADEAVASLHECRAAYESAQGVN